MRYNVEPQLYIENVISIIRRKLTQIKKPKLYKSLGFLISKNKALVNEVLPSLASVALLYGLSFVQQQVRQKLVAQHTAATDCLAVAA